MKNLQRQDHERLDPNILQKRASDPAASVWVGASAGTGKTKVLTDRVLRLLLPVSKDQPGCRADKILCLTFTKAGAGEMLLRVSKTLSHWAVTEDNDLAQDLENLMGRPARPYEISAARRLFTDVIETPGGLKIMTIHSFCQSVLGRFPLEAAINPQFQVFEEDRAKTLLEKARMDIMKQTQQEKTLPLALALNTIATTINEEDFFTLLRNINSERKQLQELLARHFDIDGLYAFICDRLSIKQNQDERSLLMETLKEPSLPKDLLVNAANILSRSQNAADKNNASVLLTFLQTPPERRIEYFAIYKKVFLTEKNTLRTKLTAKAVLESDPWINDLFTREAERLLDVLDQIHAAQCAAFTRDLLRISIAILERYEQHKQRAGGLDFDDLIIKTLNLLQGKTTGIQQESSAQWVHYKLDQGLFHILIDEAQDTNPEQWQIIEALCDDFFSGQTAHAETRTVFTVGDEKQSIYSFQRASPQEFFRMKSAFAKKIQASKQSWDEVPMNISFRSSQSILEAVDAVFKSPTVRKDISAQDIAHWPYREGQEGLVELWPLFETEAQEPTSLWNPQPQKTTAEDGSEKLVRHIATQIRSWLDTQELLPSHNRAVQPGDILILVRTRSKLVRQISKALKDMNIPVNGLDRIILSEQLIIKDILALADFALQPADDLALACILKSPFIGLSEEALYNLAIDRAGASLWQSVQTRAEDTLVSYLRFILKIGKDLSPYEFFSRFLQTACPADSLSAKRALLERLGLDALEAVDEFLNAALSFENDPAPSLQKFVHTQRSQITEIKREQDATNNAVRIMTVHGAKGLQAPIVILPDTTASSSTHAPNTSEKRILWPSQTGDPYPLWSPRKDTDCALYTQGMARMNERLDAEYRRLLYVAMTRAEDRLYIGGAQGKKKISDQCWYNLIEPGLRQHPDIETLPDGTVRLHNPQQKDGDKKSKAETITPLNIALPDWFYTPALEEKNTLNIVRPSHLEEAALSPLESTDQSRFLRGNLTHKLLQILPDMPVDKRASAAEHYLSNSHQNLSAEIKAEILHETLSILTHPAFKDIFGPGSIAEVPITGQLESGQRLSGQRLSGQIDRLLITPEDIYILDFKTNRPPPRDPKDVPQTYKEQMRLYKEILTKIYPNRTIHTALLWTQGPSLMPLDPE